jgi:hypothetical protein
MNSKNFVLPLVFVSGVAISGERLVGDTLKAFWTENTIIGTHHKLGPI